ASPARKYALPVHVDEPSGIPTVCVSALSGGTATQAAVSSAFGDMTRDSVVSVLFQRLTSWVMMRLSVAGSRCAGVAHGRYGVGARHVAPTNSAALKCHLRGSREKRIAGRLLVKNKIDTPVSSRAATPLRGSEAAANHRTMRPARVIEDQGCSRAGESARKMKAVTLSRTASGEYIALWN